MHAADLIPLLAEVLPSRGRIGCATAAVADAVTASRPAADEAEGVVVDDLSAVTPGSLDGVVLLDGEIAAAGIRGPEIIAAAVEACRPGSVIALAAPSATWHRLRGGGQGDVPNGMTAGDLAHGLEERGCAVDLVVGVGAAAALADRAWAGAADLAADRTPGLVDAGPLVLAAGVTPTTSAERSRVFFGSITRRIVAASVICTDDEGRILIIDDLFKGAWALPGGLVDAGEAPDAAARREALEEGGVEVVIGELLGVFSHTHPDRLHLIYAARPVRPTPDPVPIHTHEVGASRWVSVADALRITAPDHAAKIRACAESPGSTWGR